MNSWIDVAGWTLVHFVWEGALIGLIAFIALRLLRGGSPQTRYAAACAALCIMIAAPVITAGVLSRSISPLGAGPAMNPRVEPPISGRASTTQRAPSATPMASEGSSRSTRHVTFDPWPPIVVAFWLAGVAVVTWPAKSASARRVQ